MKDILDVRIGNLGVALALGAGLCLLSMGCLDFGNHTTGPTQVNNQTVTVPTAPPTAAPTARPVASSGECRQIPASIRVGPYAIEGCSPKPGNDDHALPVGCLALFTATPKDKDNHDLPEDDPIHSLQPVWSFSGPVSFTTYFVNGRQEYYNRKVSRLGAGDISIQVQVCGVTGTWTAAN